MPDGIANAATAPCGSASAAAAPSDNASSSANVTVRSGVISAGRSPNRCAAPAIDSGSKWQRQHADGVAAHDLVNGVGGHTVHQLGGHLLRVGPGGVGVRVVGFERDVVDADLVERVD